MALDAGFACRDFPIMRENELLRRKPIVRLIISKSFGRYVGGNALRKGQVVSAKDSSMPKFVKSTEDSEDLDPTF